MLLHTPTNFDNHTLISTPGAFKISNHCSSLNLIGHVHIPTWVTKTVPACQSGQTLPPRGLVHETRKGSAVNTHYSIVAVTI